VKLAADAGCCGQIAKSITVASAPASHRLIHVYVMFLTPFLYLC